MDGVMDLMFSRAAKANPMGPDDYEQDGLLYCGACRTPKQCRLTLGGRVMIAPCQCACAERRYQAEESRRRAEEDRLKIDSLRETGIEDKSLRRCSFAGARPSKLLDKCRRYAEQWERVRNANMGLLLWGEPGGGKTFAAACVANALIDRGIPAMITSFPRILAAKWDERAELIWQISRFPLLVLDDLGTERTNEFSTEIVYTVVDERYKSGKPLIVTTNLDIGTIRNPPNVDRQRIFERILEMCTPVRAEPMQFRKAAAGRKLNLAREILGGEKQ